MRGKGASRSGLFLMELILSIMFFSLAGAVCVRLFVSSHLTSKNSVELNFALEWSQNVAEAFYGCNGSKEEMIKLFPNLCFDGKADSEPDFYLLFDEDFSPVLLTEEQRGGSLSDVDCAYLLSVKVSEEGDLVVCHIRADRASRKKDISGDGDAIYELMVSLFPLKEAAYEV